MSVLKLKAAHASAEPHAQPSWLAHTIIHVTRNSRDDGSARHFRMHPIMDNGAFNCTIEAAMSAFGCMIDIQFLIDPKKAVEYVVKYLSKPETDGVHLSNTLTKMIKRCATEATAPQHVASGCSMLTSQSVAMVIGRLQHLQWV